MFATSETLRLNVQNLRALSELRKYAICSLTVQRDTLEAVLKPAATRYTRTNRPMAEDTADLAAAFAEGAEHGDHRAWESINAAIRPVIAATIHRVLTRYGVSRDQCDDLIQESFLKICSGDRNHSEIAQLAYRGHSGIHPNDRVFGRPRLCPGSNCSEAGCRSDT